MIVGIRTGLLELMVLAIPLGSITTVAIITDIPLLIVVTLVGCITLLYSLQYFLILKRLSGDKAITTGSWLFTPFGQALLDGICKQKAQRKNLESDIERLKNQGLKRKKKLVSAVRGLRESLSALPDAIVALDRNNRIEWWNKAAIELLNLSSSLDQGKRIEVIIDARGFREFVALPISDEQLDVPSPVSPDKLLSIRITPYGNEQRLLQARDVTLIRQLESVRQDFVANASHELRTPLTVIHGYLESLIDRSVTDQGQLTAVLSQMYQQTTRIKGIVEDMLTLSHLEQQISPPTQPVDVDRLLEQVRNEAEVLSGEKCHQISLDVESGYVIEWSLEEVRSLLSNLTVNAVRYTPAGGLITLRWWVETRGAYFVVEDTGIGIDESHISRITERFYRVDVARSRESGGTGLGLAIVKHVLVRMQGDLTVNSVLGSGSTFTCYLPGSLVHRRAA